MDHTALLLVGKPRRNQDGISPGNFRNTEVGQESASGSPVASKCFAASFGIPTKRGVLAATEFSATNRVVVGCTLFENGYPEGQALTVSSVDDAVDERRG